MSVNSKSNRMKLKYQVGPDTYQSASVVALVHRGVSRWRDGHVTQYQVGSHFLLLFTLQIYYGMLLLLLGSAGPSVIKVF
jgi:hypothetical protein